MQRLLLVLVLVALCVVAGYGLYAGWRHRADRQSGLAPLPGTPPDLGPDLVEPLAGLYISTTTSGSWQDRIVAQGLGRRSAGAVRLSADGVCIERDGADDIFVPLADLATVTTAPGIAGKVMGMADGVLIVRWSLGGTLLDSGFRADDADAQVHFLDVARSLIAGRPGTGRTTDSPSTNGAP
ncbi:MAG TPA: transporter [Nakamurella sp.]